VSAFRYEVVVRSRAGRERTRQFNADEPLTAGAVLFLDGRYWLVERIDRAGDDGPERALAKPARYRIRLHRPDGREELGAFRRYRPDAPRVGHSFTTTADGVPVVWAVIDEQLLLDETGEPYLDLRAERDYGEAEGDVPSHELEHTQAAGGPSLPADATSLLDRAVREGLSVELVALDPGEAPDWTAAGRYIDALILEEIEDDLFELCGVNTDDDPQETWLGIVQVRLRSDVAAFRADLEGDHDAIEEWDFQGGRVFASIGQTEEEADPNNGHGWMSRLVDAGVLTAAGFSRVRRRELDIAT
jgi:hypothetical protein